MSAADPPPLPLSDPDAPSGAAWTGTPRCDGVVVLLQSQPYPEDDEIEGGLHVQLSRGGVDGVQLLDGIGRAANIS